VVKRSLVPPLPALISPRIPRHVQVPPKGPSEAHARSYQREAQARYQQRRQRRGVVLGEVGVSALRAVELERLGVGALWWRVGRWVRYLGGLAHAAGIEGVKDVDDEGGGRGEDDIAVGSCVLVTFAQYALLVELKIGRRTTYPYSGSIVRVAIVAIGALLVAIEWLR
jgi:hypothetical protein